MSDIHCGNCGEPWEVYVVNRNFDDILSEDEIPVEDPSSYFKRGKGCPTCDWGDKDDVSLARTHTPGELDAQRIKDISNNTDEDPLKYF